MIVWLKSSKSQLLKTFCGLKISWILRKLWAKTCLHVFWAFDQLFIVFYIFDTFDIHSLLCIEICIVYLRHLRHCFDLLYSIQCYVSQHLQHQTMCIDTYWHVPFNVYTRSKVTMSVNEWLPHYLIWSRSHCNSKG